MKKFVAALCVTILLVTALAGCSGKGDSLGKEYTVAAGDVGKLIAYDVPEGYELYGSNSSSAVYVVYGPGGAEEEDYAQVIEIGYDYTTERWNKAIGTGKQEILEDELMTDFQDNLTLSFVMPAGHPAIRIDDHEDGELVEVTYVLLVGEWRVSIIVRGYPENIEQANNDANALIESIRLEQLVLGG